MLKIIGSMRKIVLARDEESLRGLRAAAEKSGAKLDLEQRGNRLFGRSIFLGYDLPNGNGDAIPSFYASEFGPSFIDKHLDFEHREDQDNIIGKVRATWHVENQIPLGEGPRVIGRNAFGRDLDGRPPLFRLLSGQGEPINGFLRELQVEGIFEINRETKMGDIVARRLLSGEMDSVSQEASTAFCQCSVCGHKIQFPFDPICDHLLSGHLMIRSWQVKGYDEEVLGYKVHHDPVGTGLGVVQVPAFDRARVLEMSAALKSGQMSYEAALAIVREHERMMGLEADRNLITAAVRDFEMIAKDVAKPKPIYFGGSFLRADGVRRTVRAESEGLALLDGIAKKVKETKGWDVTLEYPGFLEIGGLLDDGYVLVATPWFNYPDKLDLQINAPNYKKGEELWAGEPIGEGPESVPFPAQDSGVGVDAMADAYVAAVEAALPELNGFAKRHKGSSVAGAADGLRGVRVTFDDGNVIETDMSAGLSDEDIRSYYAVGKEFNVGSGADDKMAKVAKVEILAAKRAAVEYRGYTIEESGDSFYVKDPKGQRAFAEVPASVETAKKWIDRELAVKTKASLEPGEVMDDPEHPYIVWNNYEDMPAFPNSFATVEEAKAAAEGKMAAWKAQGYYKTSDGLRVPADSLRLVVLDEKTAADDQTDAVLVIADDRNPGGYVRSALRGSLRALNLKAGFFSWRTSDTDRTLVSFDYADPEQEDEGTMVLEEATLLLPDGTKISGKYDGYGRLGDKDIFAAVWGAMRGVEVTPENEEKLRDEVFDGHYEEVLKNVKLVENPTLSFDDVEPSESARSQGYFFDDPEDEDDIEDEDEDEDEDIDASLKASPEKVELPVSHIRKDLKEFKDVKEVMEEAIADDEKALEGAPRVDASDALLKAIAATMPLDSDSAEALAAKVHTAAVIEARLNRETFSVVRHAHLAAAIGARGAMPEAALLDGASRAGRLAVFQSALDSAKAAMAARTDLELPAESGEGAVPAWTMRHAASALSGAKFASPRFVRALAEIDRAMPSIAGFHARMDSARYVGSPLRSRLAAPAKLAAAMADHDALHRKIDAEAKKAGSFGAESIEKSASRLAAALEALAADELAEKFSMRAMAAVEAAIGKSSPAFAARRLRLPEGALNTVKAAVASKDAGIALAALGVVAMHTEAHLSRAEKDAAKVLATAKVTNSAGASDVVNACSTLCAGADRSPILEASAAFLERHAVMAKDLLNLERQQAVRRTVAAAWAKVFDADPSADPRKSFGPVVAAAKCPVQVAVRAGLRIQSAGGLWPWTSQGDVASETWPQFIEARSDEELEKTAQDWEARLKTAVGFDAKATIEANVRRLRSVLDARRQARGLSASLVGSPDPVGAYWVLRASDGRVMLRVPLRRILGGRRDATAVKWASSARYGQALAAKARSFGVGVVEAGLFPAAAVKESDRPWEQHPEEGKRAGTQWEVVRYYGGSARDRKYFGDEKKAEEYAAKLEAEHPEDDVEILPHPDFRRRPRAAKDIAREVAEMILYDGIAREVEDRDGEFGKKISHRDFVQPQQDVLNTVPEALRAAGIDPEPLLAAVEEQVRKHPDELSGGDVWSAWEHLSDYGVGQDQVYEALTAYAARDGVEAAAAAPFKRGDLVRYSGSSPDMKHLEGRTFRVESVVPEDDTTVMRGQTVFREMLPDGKVGSMHHHLPTSSLSKVDVAPGRGGE